MLNEFISTVYSLVRNGKWAELQTYFALIKDLLTQPSAVITPGTPTQKE